MSEQFQAPRDCRDPQLGVFLEGYLDRSLSEADRDAFEEHYFDCPACLAQVRMHGLIRRAVASGPASASGSAPSASAIPVRFKGMWAAALVVAVLAAGIAFVVVRRAPGPNGVGEELPVELTLHVVEREGGSVVTAPAGSPLDLTLLAELSTKEGTRYDVRIENPVGSIVFAASDLVPMDEYRIRLIVPRGPDAPGRYRIVLGEHLGGGPVGAEWRYTLEVQPRSARGGNP